MLFQVGAFGGLLSGAHTGAITIGELSQKGNFAIGTYEGANGELIAFDRNFYHIDGNGNANIADKNFTTPFAMTVDFSSNKTFELENIPSMSQLTEILEKNIASKNYIYAIRIDGAFDKLKLRSLLGQQKPYKPLPEILPKIQLAFESEKSTGTIVCFFFPGFMDKINVSGFHMHYLDAAKKFGGHVFDLKIISAKIQIQKITDFSMLLPTNEDFSSRDLANFSEHAAHKVEKG